jgi:hypothetical protein
MLFFIEKQDHHRHLLSCSLIQEAHLNQVIFIFIEKLLTF